MKAKQGELVQGMKREEAIMAWGFPEDVQRIQENGLLFDQWRYDKSFVYLVNSQVALVPPE